MIYASLFSAVDMYLLSMVVFQRWVHFPIYFFRPDSRRLLGKRLAIIISICQFIWDIEQKTRLWPISKKSASHPRQRSPTTLRHTIFRFDPPVLFHYFVLSCTFTIEVNSLEIQFYHLLVSIHLLRDSGLFFAALFISWLAYTISSPWTDAGLGSDYIDGGQVSAGFRGNTLSG